MDTPKKVVNYLDGGNRWENPGFQIEMSLLDSSAKHIIGREYEMKNMLWNLEVIKGEEFAFQIMLKGNAPYFALLDRTKDLHWTGLGDRVRVEMAGDPGFFKMYFLGYVLDDSGNLIADPILNGRSQHVPGGNQVIWVSGRIPDEYQGAAIKLHFKVGHAAGYEKEKIIAETSLDIDIIDYAAKSVKDGEFYLDLWQHFSAWARAYEVDYYSEAHFQIIDHYMEALSNIGQRVIDLIVTDYPWAGQRCYQVEANPSSLYEYNIVRVYKNREGELRCDFSAMDRLLDICMRHGISEEINLFGMLGNWDAYSFGNPVQDYSDPMRISFYDEAVGGCDYIRTREELGVYFAQVLGHLVDLGLWEKVKVISDEPDNVELFKGCMAFIQSTIPGKTVQFKSAIHDQTFYESFGDNIQSLSLNTCEAIRNIDGLGDMKAAIESKGGRFTWYSCCFPDQLNIFIKSTLIDSRLIGWYTYYWDFHGFLRWAYAIWPSDPMKDIRYKYPRWSAGDMFFVYPGKDMRPMSSIREKNMLFGIQDFDIFKALEKAGVDGEILRGTMAKLLGHKNDMKALADRTIRLDYSMDLSVYMKLRNTLIKQYLVKSPH